MPATVWARDVFPNLAEKARDRVITHNVIRLLPQAVPTRVELVLGKATSDSFKFLPSGVNNFSRGAFYERKGN
jgi:hypothetical protein